MALREKAGRDMNDLVSVRLLDQDTAPLDFAAAAEALWRRLCSDLALLGRPGEGGWAAAAATAAVFRRHLLLWQVFHFMFD